MKRDAKAERVDNKHAFSRRETSRVRVRVCMIACERVHMYEEVTSVYLCFCVVKWVQREGERRGRGGG